MHLAELSRIVTDHWEFNKENYPEMGEGEAEITFGFRHVLMHQAKALGKLADAVEPLDHGGQLNPSELARALRNFLINTLELAYI